MISSIMLVSGVLMSLALGVLVAYGVCIVMFAVLKMRVRQAVAAQAPQGVAVRLETAGN